MTLTLRGKINYNANNKCKCVRTVSSTPKLQNACRRNQKKTRSAPKALEKMCFGRLKKRTLWDYSHNKSATQRRKNTCINSLYRDGKISICKLYMGGFFVDPPHPRSDYHCLESYFGKLTLQIGIHGVLANQIELIKN